MKINKIRWYCCDPGWQALCPCGWESKRGETEVVGKQVDEHKTKCSQAEAELAWPPTEGERAG